MAEASNSATLDRDEVARFAKARGPTGGTPTAPSSRSIASTRQRLTYIRDQLCRHFGRDKTEARA